MIVVKLESPIGSQSKVRPGLSGYHLMLILIISMKKKIPEI